jgi:hypothetical protein
VAAVAAEPLRDPHPGADGSGTKREGHRPAAVHGDVRRREAVDLRQADALPAALDDADHDHELTPRGGRSRRCAGDVQRQREQQGEQL